MRLTLLLAILCVPLPASGGAWMRDVGETFLSFSSTIDEVGQAGNSLYLTHGLRPKLTIGAKIDTDMLVGQLVNGTGFVFARKPLPTDDRSFKLAYEIGIGSTLGPDPLALLRAGLSYGRGFTLWGKSGWVALDSAAEWEVENSVTTYKLDSTIGLSLSARFQVMMQVFLTEIESDLSTTIAPSVIWRPKKDGPTRFHIGMEKEDGTFAFKLGLWRTF
ncbi:hypothetical protein [Tateyamaria sp. Alg231-49]|uniref:hypothetical protein n=1 Tax=Tateyamaria sp. Alg231-49 TaxID=1922219 RepID=UPI000D550831|nr:hypothetical protein [Tateyamaria sp. Alg231-49]